MVTPKAPVHVTLNPKVQPAPAPCPVFGPGCDKPIRLSQSAYWILRLPYPFKLIFNLKIKILCFFSNINFFRFCCIFINHNLHTWSVLFLSDSADMFMLVTMDLMFPQKNLFLSPMADSLRECMVSWNWHQTKKYSGESRR